MPAQGGGVIVNTASISAEVGFATIAPYNAGKHAVASLTKVAALEYAADNIRSTRSRPARWTHRCCGGPLRRSGRPTRRSRGTTRSDASCAEEMAAVVMWLGSEEAGAVIGTDVDASGGYLTG
ncbi:SDR family oxidoreductase [Streptomyces sp. SA15]|uniref:SDR family oxidoreductase n=1 Tax=Streptomyces sp. SA15 TaxID=934019 RepID=UPI001C532894|nr:SDR family oxidoreductase [Streptomyces sp. SA15]